MKMLNKLIELMNKHQMVAIYSSDEDYFYTGYIQAADETGILLSKQNYGGYNNGFIFFTDIFHFETESMDTKRHERLFQLRGIVPEQFEVPENNHLLETLLTICFEKKLFCNIVRSENDTNDVTGFISELSEDYLCLDCIDKYGMCFGKCYLEKSDIYILCIEGEDEQARRLLYENA